MISAVLYRHPPLLILLTVAIAAIGLSSYSILPRIEDPELGQRVAVVSAVFPGADPARVEARVTEVLEERLGDIAEIKELRSFSRVGVSEVLIELRNEVTDTDPVWSRVRERIGDAAAELPAGAFAPEFHRIELRAFAEILAIRSSGDGAADLSVMRRLARDLKLALKGVRGTESVRIFGDPGEQVLVEIQPQVLSAIGLPAAAVSQQIRQRDATQPAGMMRAGGVKLLLDVQDQLGSLQSLGETEIQYGLGETVSLADIATIRKGAVEPPASLSLVDGERAVVVAALVRDDVRIDQWSDRVEIALDDFRERLPAGFDIDVVFAQSKYVESRLHQLLWNLLLGTAAVVVIVLLLMGWRSTIVVGAALPLSALMVLSGMRALGIPLHQMSITGLIIALGLLIDNAIIIVDEVRSRIWAGLAPDRASDDSVSHLAIPLFGSTLTTALAFAPIALLPGPPGEFVGPIAVSVILAIGSSFLLAMTITPALTALLQGRTGPRTLISYGASSRWATRLYEKTLTGVLRNPVLGVVLGVALPILGFVLAATLPEQFFPPTDRDQIQIEIDLSASALLSDTRATAEEVRRVVLENDQVARMHWFLGESAPTFYYNVVPRRRNVDSYGQALVQLKPGANSRDVVRTLQETLAPRFAGSRVIVRQLEQGPPFDAPVEVRILGPDLSVLRRLGQELRLLLSQTAKVIGTRSDIEDSLLTVAISVDEQEARLAGLSQNEIARQLYTSVDGAAGGTLLEGTEEIPIRVRMAQDQGLQQLFLLEFPSASRGMPVMPRAAGPPSMPAAPTLSALAESELSSSLAQIIRLNGQRMNELKAYVLPGTLPSSVLAEFERRVAASGFQLPSDYSLAYGGEAAQRDEAVGNLLANGIVLVALIMITLVASFMSLRIALIIAAVGGLSIGLGTGALWVFGYPFGFTAMLGIMGLVGLAINDAIVVMAAIRGEPAARAGDLDAMKTVVVQCTRHVLTTTLTTIAGFTPLVLGGGGFWPPLAIAIAAGVGGATLFALYLVPSLYLLMCVRGASHRA